MNVLTQQQRLSSQPTAHAILAEAIRDKRKVAALFGGDLVLFCPHALARRGNGLHVLAYLLRADGMLIAEAPVSPRRWRWLPLAELTGVVAAAGGWYGGPTAPRPALAGAQIELEVPETEAPRR